MDRGKDLFNMVWVMTCTPPPDLAKFKNEIAPHKQRAGVSISSFVAGINDKICAALSNWEYSQSPDVHSVLVFSVTGGKKRTHLFKITLESVATLYIDCNAQAAASSNKKCTTPVKTGVLHSYRKL